MEAGDVEWSRRVSSTKHIHKRRRRKRRRNNATSDFRIRRVSYRLNKCDGDFYILSPHVNTSNWIALDFFLKALQTMYYCHVQSKVPVAWSLFFLLFRFSQLFPPFSLIYSLIVPFRLNEPEEKKKKKKKLRRKNEHVTPGTLIEIFWILCKMSSFIDHFQYQLEAIYPEL
jgi:hypothetical protein